MLSISHAGIVAVTAWPGPRHDLRTSACPIRREVADDAATAPIPRATMITGRDLSLIPRGAARGHAPVETALLDADGVIAAIDEAWEAFCLANGGDPARAGVGLSYLALCDAAASTDRHSGAVAAAIRAALCGDLPAPARIEVPCHAPERSRHFDVLISSRRDDRGTVLGATVTLSEIVPVARPVVSPGTRGT